MQICAVCKVPYKRGLDGKCEKEGMWSELSISEVLNFTHLSLSLSPSPLQLKLVLAVAAVILAV